MIRRFSCGLVAMVQVWGLLTFTAPAAESRPNVILILSDDQGTLDLNCYGSKDLFTPNLDALETSAERREDAAVWFQEQQYDSERRVAQGLIEFDGR